MNPASAYHCDQAHDSQGETCRLQDVDQQTEEVRSLHTFAAEASNAADEMAERLAIHADQLQGLITENADLRRSIQTLQQIVDALCSCPKCRALLGQPWIILECGTIQERAFTSELITLTITRLRRLPGMSNHKLWRPRL
ncbi:hypothetical protein AURDEDRAFT_160811 [Auricularia subglabra TFB-10046 SS5]|nr:hypothetical protein AURDEDRAFT_160811 [Auricularia subglabra TFB-10046 SS5]